MEEEENNFEQIEFNNNINFTSKNSKLPNYSSLNKEINQNSYNNSILIGSYSILNGLLSNSKSYAKSDRMGYNNINKKRKSPTKSSVITFSKLNLVDAYNHLVESNAKRNNNYFSPEHPPIQMQNNIYDKSTFSGNNNCQYLNQKLELSNNLLLSNSNFIPSDFNGNINLQINKPINDNYNKRNNSMINKSKILNNNKLSQKSYNHRQSNLNINNLKNNNINNKKYFSYNKKNNNVGIKENQYFIVNQLLEIKKRLKELHLCNIENKRVIFNYQIEYSKMQNTLFNEIQNFIKIINSKEEEIIKIKTELNKLYKIEENYEKNKENINNLKEEKNNINLKSNELKNEYYNLMSEIDKYKIIMKDIKINLKNEEYLQNKVIEQEKLINEYKQKNKEMENNFENLNKENKEMKRQILVLESQKKNITKEFKIKKDNLDKIKGESEQLTKERDEIKKQLNILNNELKRLKESNNRINNIKINNSIKKQEILNLKEIIDTLTKENKKLEQNNNILKQTINDMDKEKYKSKSKSKLSNLKKSKILTGTKKFTQLTKVKNNAFTYYSRSVIKSMNDGIDKIIKKKKFVKIKISNNVISFGFIGISKKMPNKKYKIEEINKLKNQINEKDNIIQSLEKEIKNNINEKDNIIQSLEKEIKNNINEIDGYQKQLNEKENIIHSLEKQKKNNMEEIEGLKSSNEELTISIKNLEDFLGASEILTISTSADFELEKLENYRKLINNGVKVKINNLGDRNEIVECKKRIEELENRIMELNKQIELIQMDKSNIKLELEKFKKENYYLKINKKI